MSKVRVYELAKELGLDNKAVLALCTQLEFEDKSSHSSSLSDDEAEKIRRFVIRKAVNEKGAAQKEVSKEGHLLTESRMGSVIRRRKKDPSLEEAVPVVSDVEAVEEQREETEVQKTDSSAEVVEQEAQQAEGKVVEPRKSDLHKSKILGRISIGKDSAAEEVEQAAAAAEKVSSKEQEEQVVVLSEEEQLAETRKRHGISAPKILGKIDLPTKNNLAAAEVAKKSQAAGKKSPAESLIDDDEDSLGKSGKAKKKGKSFERADLDDHDSKKPRKKQVLRKDELLDYEDERDGWRTKKVKKKDKKTEQEDSPLEANAMKQAKKQVKVAGAISVGELAKQMSVKVSEVISILMKLGIMAGINHLIDFDTATVIASEFGYTTSNTDQDVEEMIADLQKEEEVQDKLKLRPPVVTVMGHVDHGKTSLLDAIRKTTVTKSEFGGITQHIGAYNVVSPSGGSVTFLDTPGHEAFTAMRSRGAKVTDIVVLVVAADDGVMPQTIEAINHAQAAKVPIIVAVNKIDKEGANRDKVLAQLSEHGLVPEEWGGDTLICNVSALTREGVDQLLESLYLQAEILELKANADRLAIGTIVESKIDRGRGPVATVLVQKGTLRKGDVFVAGSVFGKVRALVADNGDKVDEAGPSIPVEVLGASSAPLAGDDFIVFASETEARSIADRRQQSKRLKELAQADKGVAATGGLTLERFSELVNTSEDLKELPLIVKGDVQGSVEAVASALEQLSNEEVKVRVIHRAVGAISENDVQLAAASKAILIGFNVRADARAAAVLEGEEVQVLYSRVIYELIDQVTLAIKGMKAPVFKEKTLGRVEVRQTFKVPKQGVIAGSYVLDGTVNRAANVRLLRDSTVVFEGKLSSLRRFKDDVKEVQAGYECGIGIEGYSDIKAGDIIEVYKIEEVAQ